MIIHATEESRDVIMSKRAARPTIYVADELGTVARRLNQTMTFWERQLNLDPEAGIHQGYSLYLIWALKPVFLRDAVLANPFASTHFFWFDMGCIRDMVYFDRSLFSVPAQVNLYNQSVYFVLVRPFDEPEAHSGVISDDHISGAMWGGSARAVLNYHAVYFEYFEQLASQGVFVGKDQTVMNTACFRTPGLCVFVQPDESLYNPWFNMLPFLLGQNINSLYVPAFPPVFAKLDTLSRAPVQERVLIATMLTDDIDNYARGAVKLLVSIKRSLSSDIHTSNIEYRLMELDSKPIPNKATRELLSNAGWQIFSVPRIPPRSGTNTFGRFIDQFTKLNLWNMTQYDRVIYFDSDCLVTGSLNNLLSMKIGPGLWVTRDIRGGQWVDGFNMGVFMIQPSAYEFQQLLHSKDDPDFHFETMMAEQGFLNVYYQGKWTDFGFCNNANLAAYKDDPDLWSREFTAGINVIHYTMSKPWACTQEYAPVCDMWNKV